MSGIFWLASYPKSGNTWVRVFLTNLRRNQPTPADINALDDTPIASARRILDEAIGFETSDLDSEQVECLRPAAYTHIAAQMETPMILKIHDALVCTPAGQLLVPAVATCGVIYLVRNPLDVAVSQACAGGYAVDEAIRRMADRQRVLASAGVALHAQVRQRLLCWSGHVLSWTATRPWPTLVVRYEDLLERPQEHFARIARFVELPSTPERIARAIKFSAIEELQRQETTHGFKEGPPTGTPFFRQGHAGEWKKHLAAGQAKAIYQRHGPVMASLGY